MPRAELYTSRTCHCPWSLPQLAVISWQAVTVPSNISSAQEAIWAVQESRQALVSGSAGALAAQQREAEMSEDDVKALLDRCLQS